MSLAAVIAFIVHGLRISAPYSLAALGGTVAERSGVVSLALEGMLLGGAFAATIGSDAGGLPLGLVAGAAGGLLVAAMVALVVLRGRADQIVAGVAMNILALGLTRYFLKLVYHSASNSAKVPGFGDAVVVDLVLAATAVLVVGVQIWMARTPGGLRLRAAGEHPDAADSLGVNVLKTRLSAVLVSGVFAGLGGAWLALDNRGFVSNMSGGRGYIALAAVIFGKWNPAGAAAACLLFGFADATQLQLQSWTTAIPRELVQILPHVLTIVTLCGLIGRSRAPRALGTPWTSVR